MLTKCSTCGFKEVQHGRKCRAMDSETGAGRWGCLSVRMVGCNALDLKVYKTRGEGKTFVSARDVYRRWLRERAREVGRRGLLGIFDEQAIRRCMNASKFKLR